MKSLNLNKNKNKKDLSTKFLCVNEDEIYFYDDSGNEVYLKDYFNNNNVSINNRNIFLGVCNKLLYVEEFVTNLRFDHTGLGMILENINGHIDIGSSNRVKTIAEEEFEEKVMGSSFLQSSSQGINFSTSIKYVNYNYLKEFFNNLKSNGELENYIKSVTSFISDGIYYTSRRNIIQRFEYVK